MRHLIRPMLLEDVHQATELERGCFPSQWPPQQFRRDLTSNSMAHYLVACDEADQQLVSLIGLWLMAGEAHITTIAVRQAYRRQGIGELLLISAIDLAILKDAQVMTLELRASNEAARALYLKYGFSERGARRSYYHDNGEDAVIMTTDTLISPAFQGRFQHMSQAHIQRWGLAQRQLS